MSKDYFVCESFESEASTQIQLRRVIFTLHAEDITNYEISEAAIIITDWDFNIQSVISKKYRITKMTDNIQDIWLKSDEYFISDIQNYPFLDNIPTYYIPTDIKSISKLNEMLSSILLNKIDFGDEAVSLLSGEVENAWFNIFINESSLKILNKRDKEYYEKLEILINEVSYLINDKITIDSAIYESIESLLLCREMIKC